MSTARRVGIREWLGGRFRPRGGEPNVPNTFLLIGPCRRPSSPRRDVDITTSVAPRPFLLLSPLLPPLLSAPSLPSRPAPMPHTCSSARGGSAGGGACASSRGDCAAVRSTATEAIWKITGDRTPAKQVGRALLRSKHWSARFQEFVMSLDLRILTVAQTWRVGGIVFLILYQHGALPGVFAIPAGWGDMAIGITAPVVAWYWKRPFPSKTFIVWNVLGSLDLVMAVSLGVLASATPVGVLAGDVTTRLMGRFPLSLIPTFFVPLLLILHLISLSRVRRGLDCGSGRVRRT